MWKGWPRTRALGEDGEWDVESFLFLFCSQYAQNIRTKYLLRCLSRSVAVSYLCPPPPYIYIYKPQEIGRAHV